MGKGMTIVPKGPRPGNQVYGPRTGLILTSILRRVFVGKKERQAGPSKLRTVNLRDQEEEQFTDRKWSEREKNLFNIPQATSYPRPTLLDKQTSLGTLFNKEKRKESTDNKLHEEEIHQAQKVESYQKFECTRGGLTDAKPGSAEKKCQTRFR